jgi:hypothetical protein
MVRTARSNGDTNRPTFGAIQGNLDTVKTTKAGLNVDTNGQPEIWNAAGQAIYDVNSSGQPQIKNAAGSVLVEVSTLIAIPMVYKLAFTAGDGSGVIAEAANPFGFDVIITNAVLDITTQSTGASTLDVGVAATDTANDTLIDGVSGAAAGRFDNVKNAGTNGRSGVLWASDTFLTIAEASGDVTAIVGNLYVTAYRRI